jgi:hypothetical protein
MYLFSICTKSAPLLVDLILYLAPGFRSNPPTRSCSSSPFNYSPAGDLFAGDVDIVENKNLKILIRKGQKFREPRSFNWRQNIVYIMKSIEDYAKRWVKREKEGLETRHFVRMG